MLINTKYFGEIEIHESTIITFEKPLYGFPATTQYTILSDVELGTDLLWLQSVERTEICFLLANPKAFLSTYEPQASQDQLVSLGANNMEEVDCFVIVVLGNTFQESTMNLKSPILISPTTNKAQQVIVEQEYDFKQRMFPIC